MIVVDTSALVAILRGEVAGIACHQALYTADRVLLSAGTVTEALIVAARLKFRDQMAVMVEDAGFEIVPLTAARARAAGDAYRHWGKRFHPAALNFGDCFAYALAKEHACPLLFIGDDFARTDIPSVL